MTEKEWAKVFLQTLINHVQNFRGGRKYLTYGEFAKSVGYPPPYIGSNFGRRIGITLYKMGHLLDDIVVEGMKVPLIQSLIVNSVTKLPSDGIKEFWPQYPKLSKDKKRDLVHQEYQRIWEFGTRWEIVKNVLSLTDSKSPRLEKSDKRLHNPYGSEGSPEHVKLRNYVARHPELVGLKSSTASICEYPLKSGDQVDVVFETEEELIMVEVKSSRSGLDDIERGLFQCIKYKAVADAELHVMNVTKKVKAFLIIEDKFPKILNKTKNRLQTKVIENISPDEEY